MSTDGNMGFASFVEAPRRPLHGRRLPSVLDGILTMDGCEQVLGYGYFEGCRSNVRYGG
jgi:hypothetical protein